MRFFLYICLELCFFEVLEATECTLIGTRLTSNSDIIISLIINYDFYIEPKYNSANNAHIAVPPFPSYKPLAVAYGQLDLEYQCLNQ